MEQLLRRTIRPSWQIGCEMQAGRGFAGQDRCARWRTDRLRDVGACETGTLGGQSVEVWRVMLAPAVTSEVVRSEIIGEDEDDVGCARRGSRERGQRGQRTDRANQSQSVHGFAGVFGVADAGFAAAPL